MPIDLMKPLAALRGTKGPTTYDSKERKLPNESVEKTRKFASGLVTNGAAQDEVCKKK